MIRENQVWKRPTKNITSPHTSLDFLSFLLIFWQYPGHVAFGDVKTNDKYLFWPDKLNLSLIRRTNSIL